MSVRETPLRIGVCGGAEPDDAQVECAEQVGALIAEAGAVVVCGGRGGCMEAAARGAHDHGGVTIGVLPGRDARDANGYITYPLPTMMGEGRDILVVSFADAVIGIGGGWGTMTEVSFAMKLGKPVVLLQPTLAKHLDVPAVQTAEEAVRHAIDAARAVRASWTS